MDETVRRTEINSFHKSEYEQIRTEIRQRIDLQNKCLGHVLVLTGIIVAAFKSWVFHEANDEVIDGLMVLEYGSMNLRAILLIIVYLILINLLVCSWVYHTYKCLNMHAYLTTLKHTIDSELKSDIWGFQEWEGNSQREWYRTQGAYRIIIWLQPFLLYGLDFLGVICLYVLCYLRVCNEDNRFVAILWVAIPNGFFLLLAFVLFLNKKAVDIGFAPRVSGKNTE